ncbi:hypothetical protein HYPSUDRAFT_208984 [Hypholoma sublateritium FD-334 SS-4]|uniref:Uncharacterized protein n=1 Tax=Hypholoma sublateritium (strain FD-334 SS-4) TaxID=945553 RepID=A0A0D2P0A4_HYPSF|nr:hypothetical protein HYPSUDRAFT_208984 [Hypholoma sublateritium FD-334 SS-4]
MCEFAKAALGKKVVFLMKFSLHPATFPSWGSKRVPAPTASHEPPRISHRNSIFLEAPHVASTTEDSPVIVVDARQSPAPIVNFVPSKGTTQDGNVSIGDTLLVDNSLADTLMADSTTAPTIADTPVLVVQSAPPDPVDSGKSTTTAAADLFDPGVVVTAAADMSVVCDLTDVGIVIPSPTPKLCDIDLDAQLLSDEMPTIFESRSQLASTRRFCLPSLLDHSMYITFLFVSSLCTESSLGGSQVVLGGVGGLGTPCRALLFVVLYTDSDTPGALTFSGAVL